MSQGLWLPGLTGTLRDLTGATYNLSSNYTQIDANGILLPAAKSQYAIWNSSSGTTIAPLNNITGDFTLEARVSFASNFTSSYRSILGYGNGAGQHHFYAYVGGAAGPSYTLYFTTSNGGVTKNASVSLGSITLNQMYRIAIARTGGKIYFFKDGTLLNAGGSDFNWTIDLTPSTKLNVGIDDGTNGLYWDGYIDEIRISDTARWTSNYTPAALTYNYQPNGVIFTKVYDFGASNNQPATINPTLTTPTNTTVTQYVRSAASLSDLSSNLADFSLIPQPNIRSRFQQFALNLTTADAASTPTVSGVNIQNVALPTITQITAVPNPTNITNPTYTFSSDQTGTITYGGDCSSSTSSAVIGNNTITFNALTEGTHSNCTITVTNNGYPSTALNVNTFVIDTGNPSSFTLSSPSDNGSTAGGHQTLSWNASSDSESGLAKYQLYLDNALDTDNISNSTTSVTSTNSYSCGSHSWYVKATDNAGNSTDSNTLNFRLMLA